MKDMQALLRQLGEAEESPPARSSDESSREARMAAQIDAEVARLVRARRAWRTLGVASLAAAALVLIGLGLSRAGLGGYGAGIGREPVASGAPPREPARPMPAALPITSPSTAAPLARSAAPSSAPSSSGPALSARTPAESTLAKENGLFKAAAEASRQGDTDGAVAQLDRLLAEHPRSPLAQTAQVRKFRLLAKAGNLEAARREAERYLSSYPTGFAVSEAQALARGTVSPAPNREPAAP